MKQGQEEPEQEELLSSCCPLYTEGEFHGMGFTWGKLNSAALSGCRLLRACTWLAQAASHSTNTLRRFEVPPLVTVLGSFQVRIQRIPTQAEPAGAASSIPCRSRQTSSSSCCCATRSGFHVQPSASFLSPLSS